MQAKLLNFLETGLLAAAGVFVSSLITSFTANPTAFGSYTLVISGFLQVIKDVVFPQGLAVSLGIVSPR